MTFTTVKSLAEKMGKTPVEANDFPGFISNRILMPMINEAIYALFEGVGTPEAIDTVMKLGMNHPMGPLALADLIGLDTCLAIMEVLYQGVRRFEISTLPSSSKICGCRLSRQKNRKRVLYLLKQSQSSRG